MPAKLPASAVPRPLVPITPSTTVSCGLSAARKLRLALTAKLPASTVECFRNVRREVVGFIGVRRPEWID